MGFNKKEFEPTLVIHFFQVLFEKRHRFDTNDEGLYIKKKKEKKEYKNTLRTAINPNRTRRSN